MFGDYVIERARSLTMPCGKLVGLTSGEQRTACVSLQIERDAGLPKYQNPTEAMERAVSLMSLFRASQHLYAGVDAKDRGPADELPVLAADALVAAWKLDRSGKPTHLLQVSNPVLCHYCLSQPRKSSSIPT